MLIMSENKKQGLQDKKGKSVKIKTGFVDVNPSQRLNCIRQTGLWPFLVILLENEPDYKYNKLINETTDQEFDLLLSQLISMRNQLQDAEIEARKR